MKSRRHANTYRRCRHALLQMDSQTLPLTRYEFVDKNWKESFKVLKPEDLRFMNVRVRDLADRSILAQTRKAKIADSHSLSGGSGQKTRTLSWIWKMGKLSTDECVAELQQTDVQKGSKEIYDLDNQTVRAEWAKARAWAERWEEELTLVQAEMQQMVLFYQWKAGDWDSRGRTRTLTTFGDSVSRKKYTDALEGYAARQANTYSRMAQNCA